MLEAQIQEPFIPFIIQIVLSCITSSYAHSNHPVSRRSHPLCTALIQIYSFNFFNQSLSFSMGVSFLRSFATLSFAVNAAAQFAQTITVDVNQNGKSIYIAGASTSSVAAPAFTPTLVYNCYYMPLICENVANYAKSVNSGGGGDLASPQLFYFDPNDSALSSRRNSVCGCFKHDDCSTANSQGKTTKRVTAIAGQAPFDTLNTPISPANRNIILAGTNPSVDKNSGALKPRVPLPSVPGRFFNVNGVAFSCDEFPAATFIEGGSGVGGNGNKAKTICAMSNWKLYLAPSSPGKWPFPSGSGQDREQDWQGRSHNLLRVSQRTAAFTVMANHTPVQNALNVGSTRNKRGWGTVYPFSFTTTTLPPQEQTKAYVVQGSAVTKSVMRRDGTPTTSTYIATTTLNVFDDETPNLRNRDHDAHGWASAPRHRVRQALAPAQTSSSGSASTIGSSQASNLTSLSSNSTGLPITTSSILVPSSSAAPVVTPSTLVTAQISFSSRNASTSPIGSNSSSVSSPSTTASSANAGGSSLIASLLSASISATQRFTVGTNSSASGSSVTASSVAGTFGIGSSAQVLSITASTATSTTTGSSRTTLPNSSSGISTAATSQSSGAVVAGNPAATSRASAVSSSVASASSAAAALVSDPLNKQKAQTAQKQAHDAESGKPTHLLIWSPSTISDFPSCCCHVVSRNWWEPSGRCTLFVSRQSRYCGGGGGRCRCCKHRCWSLRGSS